MVVYIYGFRYAGIVYWKYIRGSYLLSKIQIGCLITYSVALVIAAFAQTIIYSLDFDFFDLKALSVGDKLKSEQFYYSLIAILYTIAISLTSVCGAIVLVLQGKELAVTRGFPDPLPLSRSRDGWVVSEYGRLQRSVLLGNIRTAQSPILAAILKNRDLYSHSSQQRHVIARENGPHAMEPFSKERVAFDGRRTTNGNGNEIEMPPYHSVD